jgi:TPR repeat protein
VTAPGLTPRAARTVTAWALAGTLGLAAWQLAAFSAQRLPRPHPLEELSYYPSGQYLEPATLGHAETVADLAWLRAVQYYGEHRLTDMQFSRLYHVFDILTSLSPHFIPAYVFGGFALAQEGNDFAHAEALMMKGVEANPTSGRLAFELGFLYYVRPGGRDLRRAAEYFERAARLPDGPPSSRRFAAFVRQNAGDLAVAWALWREVARSSENLYLRQMAEREMRRIERARATGRAERARSRLSTPEVLTRRLP